MMFADTGTAPSFGTTIVIQTRSTTFGTSGTWNDTVIVRKSRAVGRTEPPFDMQGVTTRAFKWPAPRRPNEPWYGVFATPPLYASSSSQQNATKPEKQKCKGTLQDKTRKKRKRFLQTLRAP